MTKSFSIICAVVTTFIWGTAFIAQDTGMDNIGPLTFNSARFWVGFITILPFAIFTFYLIFKNGVNDFNLENPKLMFIFILAGPMTVIPLYLYVRGVELCGLGPTGMIFYITPTLQFILGYFLYNEPLNNEKLISFILIWIAVFIYLKDLYENK